MKHEAAGLFDDALIAPPADRRMTQRVMRAWTEAGRGAFPSWTALRAIDLGQDWNWVFVVDLKQSLGFPHFVYLGPRLAQLSEVYLSGSADWTLSLLDTATTQIEAAVALEAPQESADELVLCDGRRIAFRCMTAPLAEDGTGISHVLGCAFGRLAEAQDAKPFLRAI